jgi:hypothetical protein
MIKDGVPISEKFEGLMMKPASKSISPLLKLELTKMNHSSVKIPRKRKEKIPCFFHPGVCSSRVVTTQHANTLFRKPFTS